MKFTKLMILITSASLLFGCGGKEERITAYMQKAQESYEAGDYDKARIDIKNALQIDPNNAQARFMLGRAYEGKQDFMKAYRAYSKAVELAPEEPEYLAKLGKFYLVLGGDTEKAREQLDAIKKVAPASTHALLLEAGIATQEGNTDKALGLTRQVYDAEPGNIENAIFMSGILSKDDRHPEAIEVLQSASELHPENVLLQLNMARTYLDAGDAEQSITVLKRIIEMEPSVYRHHVNLALIYSRQGMIAQSEQVLRDAISLEEDDVERRVNLVSYIQNVKSVDDAIDTAREQIAMTQEDGMLRLKLAQLQLGKEDQSAAIKTLEEIVELYPENQFGIKARLQLAAMSIEREDVEGASKWIDQAFAIASNDPEVNMAKAQIDLMNNELDQAIVSLRNVIKDDPEKLQAYMLLSRAHALNGDQEQAKDIIVRAHENNRGNLENLLALAKYYLQAKNFEATERVIDDYLRLDDSNYEAMSIKAGLLNSTGRSADAVSFAEAMIEMYPGKPNGYTQLVPGLLNDKKVEEALSLLSKGLKNTDGDFNVLTLLTKLKLMSGELDDTIDTVENYIAAFDNANAYLLLAKIHADNNDTARAVEALDTALQKHPEHESLYVNRAQLHAAAGENDRMRQLLERGVQNAESKNRLRLMLAGLYERDGDLDKAIASYRAILDTAPNNLVVMNNIAALIMESDPDESDIEEALSYVEKIKTADNPDIQDTVAWVYHYAGKHEEAAIILERLLESHPEHMLYNYHYGMVLHAQGDDDNASIHLRKALDGNKPFNGRDEAQATLDKIG